MKIQISILITLLFLGCNREIVNGNSKSTEKKHVELAKVSKVTPNEIMGIWTNGSTENATFKIEAKSIYYVDDFKDYDYEIVGDTIEIHYPDYIYRAEVLLKNDTLIMNSKEYAQARYWKFKK